MGSSGSSRPASAPWPPAASSSSSPSRRLPGLSRLPAASRHHHRARGGLVAPGGGARSGGGRRGPGRAGRTAGRATAPAGRRPGAAPRGEAERAPAPTRARPDVRRASRRGAAGGGRPEGAGPVPPAGVRPPRVVPGAAGPAGRAEGWRGGSRDVRERAHLTTRLLSVSRFFNFSLDRRHTQPARDRDIRDLAKVDEPPTPAGGREGTGRDTQTQALPEVQRHGRKMWAIWRKLQGQ